MFDPLSLAVLGATRLISFACAATMEDTFKWRLQLGVGVIFPIGLLVLALWKVTESPTFLKIKAKQTAKKGTDALDEVCIPDTI